VLLSQYDILTLQEALLNPLMTDIFNGLTEHQAYVAISFYYKNQGETGVATLSRFLPIEIQAKKSPELEFWFKTPKTSMITYYQVEGSQKKLLVINTHPPLF
jgi:endonuclease/exonuclease/phosphatase (EEP) superfamily protein YafD